MEVVRGWKQSYLLIGPDFFLLSLFWLMVHLIFTNWIGPICYRISRRTEKVNLLSLGLVSMTFFVLFWRRVIEEISRRRKMQVNLSDCLAGKKRWLPLRIELGCQFKSLSGKAQQRGCSRMLKIKKPGQGRSNHREERKRITWLARTVSQELFVYDFYQCQPAGFGFG